MIAKATGRQRRIHRSLLIEELESRIAPAAGALDTSFDGDGKVTTDLGPNHNPAYGVAIQANGKIIVAGAANNGSNDDFALVRYNTDGSLDTTFDTDGKVTTTFGTGHENARALAIQSDGKILVAGFAYTGSNNDFALARYNTDGSLDTAFDGDGKVTTSVGTGDDQAFGIAIQSDGKIILAGYAIIGGNYDVALVRYNDDGSLDTAFDSDGKATTPIGTGQDMARSVAIQSDGGIVVAGYAYNSVSGFNDLALARFEANGGLDTTFDTDGTTTTVIGTMYSEAYAVAVQSDGEIVAAGVAYNGANSDFALARYNNDGSPDTTFDDDGKLMTDIASGDCGYAVAIQGDGRIVAAGSTVLDFGVVRYNADGSLDTTFDTDGKVTTDVGGNTDVVRALALQSDGKIVAAGSATVGGFQDFAAARYIGGDPPTIGGTASGQNVNDNASLSPFSGVTIADPDSASVTVTVTLDVAAKGAFTTLNGFTPQGGGVYTFTGSPAAATTAIQGMVYDPTDNRVAPTSTETSTLTITVDDNVTLPVSDNSTTVLSLSINDLPIVDAGSDQAGNEGDEFSFSGSFTDPDVGETRTISWNFGDTGGDSGSLTPTHTYVDNGIYTVTLTITDSSGTPVSDTLTVTVNNVAPTIAVGGNPSTNEGSEYTLTLGVVTDPGTDTVTQYIVHWGDGNSDTYFVNGDKTHTYADGANNYTITVDLVDEDGTHNNAGSLGVAVDDVAPTIALSGNAGVNEGSVYTVTLGAITDPGLDTVTQYIVHWGDGNSDTYGTAGDHTHGYADGLSNCTITVDLEDEDGVHAGAGSLGVTVNNVAPTIAVSGNPTVDEGSVYTLTLGAVTDPGVDTVTQYIVHWGDGNSDTYFVDGGQTHTYADGPNNYTIIVDLADEDGTHSNAGSHGVTVNNAPPTANDDGGGSFTTDEETPFTTGDVLANDTDPADPLSVLSFDTSGTLGQVTDNGDGTFDYDPNGQFEYLAVGELATDTFTYTISDGDGGTDTATVTITINGVNDAPTANDDGGLDYETDEDSMFTTGNVLANDADPDTSDGLLVVGIDMTGTVGVVVSNGDGTFGYDPDGQFDYLAAGEFATDTFTYTVTDGNGGFDTATVTITINGVNDASAIALLTDGPDPVYRPFRLTLTASGVSDADGTVTAVEFYVDENGDNVIDGGDTLLGTGTDAGGGVWTWTNYTFGWAAGPRTYLARAQDDQGTWGEAAATTGDIAEIATVEVVPGQVILYDIDLGAAPDISAADVIVKLNTTDGSVKSVTIVGNPTGLGILVNSIGIGAVTIKDARTVKTFPVREDISFVACVGLGNQVCLNTRVTGWNIGPVLQDEGLVADADLDGDGDIDDLTAVYCGAPTKTVKVLGQVGGDVVVAGADAKFVGLGKLDVKNGDIVGEVVTTGGGLKALSLKGGNLLGNVIVNGNLGKLSVTVGKDALGLPIGGTINSVDILVSGLAKGIAANAITNSLIAAMNIGSVSVKTNLTDSRIHAGGIVDRDHNWVTQAHGNIKGVTVKGNMTDCDITAGVWLGADGAWGGGDDTVVEPDPPGILTSIISKVNVTGSIVWTQRRGILAATDVASVQAKADELIVKSENLPYVDGNLRIDAGGGW